MSVLVKGMEKPEHCGYCRFRYDGICHALQRTQYSMDECPLIDEDVIKAQLSARPERNKGKWILTKNGIWYCSECASMAPYYYMSEKQKTSNYCYICGAKMENIDSK